MHPDLGSVEIPRERVVDHGGVEVSAVHGPQRRSLALLGGELDGAELFLDGNADDGHPIALVACICSSHCRIYVVFSQTVSRSCEPPKLLLVLVMTKARSRSWGFSEE